MREVFARIGFGHWRIQRTFASWPTPGPSVGGLTGGPGELFVVEAKVSGGTHLLRCALSGLPSLGPLVGVQTARGCAEQPSLNGNRRHDSIGQHVEIVVVPFAGWPGSGGAFENQIIFVQTKSAPSVLRVSKEQLKR